MKLRQKRRRALLLALSAWILAMSLQGDQRSMLPATGSAESAAHERGPVWLRIVVLDAEGAPAAGARVSLYSLGEHGRLLYRGLADSEGALRLRGRRGRRVQLRAQLPGHAVGLRTIPLEGEQILRLGRAERLRGQILDAEGRPIEGARAHLRWGGEGEEEGPALELETDEEGRFFTEEVPAGVVTVIAVAPGHRSHRRRLTLPTEEEPRFLLHRSAVIAGRVVGEAGRPERDARITLVGSAIWPAREIRSDASGAFLLRDLPPGVYELRARGASGVAEPRRGIELEEGGLLYYTFFLHRGGGAAGRVVEAYGGAPIEGARVMITSTALDAAPRAAASDAQGQFRLTGLSAASYQVRAEAEGYVPLVVEAWRPGEPLLLRMRRGATLSGRVLDAEGRPLAGVHISILGETEARAPIELSESRAEMSQRVFMTHLNTETDALAEALGPLPVLSGRPVPEIPSESEPRFDPSFDRGAASLGPLPPPPPAVAAALIRTFRTDDWGGFSLRGVPPGRVQVVARLEGYAPAATPRLAVDEGVEREGLEIVLYPSGRIVGRVLDARGDPAAGVSVELRSDREPHPRATISGERGEIEFEDAYGAITLTAMAQDQPPVRVQVEVGSGERAEVELRLLQALFTLYGRTVDGRGFPIAAALVRLRSLDPRTPFERNVQSAEDGTFVLAGLPPPPYELSAEHPDRASARIPEVRALPQPPDYLPLPLPLGATLSGRILDDRSGASIPGTEIRVSDEGLPPRRFSARADAEGRFSIDRLPAGRWVVEARAPGHLGARAEALLRERSFGLPDVEMDPISLVEAGVILGRVLDPLGEGVSRATVTLVGAEGGPTATSEAGGSFRLEGVPEGIVDLRASHPAGGVGVYERVRVVAGDQTAGILLRLPRRLDYESAEEAPGRVVGVALELTEGEGAVEILRVAEGSAASRAGLLPGDRLLSVDDVEAGSAEQGAALLRGASGVAAQLVVERDGEVTRLRVQREPWWPEE